MKSPPDKIDIVVVCDDSYAMPLATTLRSIVAANGSNLPIHVHVLTNHFREQVRERVLDSLPPGSAIIEWKAVDLSRFRSFHTISHISPITYARFLLSETLPQSLQRVLYLDVDILVLGDLAELWSTEMSGASVSAVRDIGVDPLLKCEDPRVIDVPRVANYFNAGVMLIDLEKWRGNDIERRALEFLDKHPKTPFSDQDALNAVLDGHWMEIDQQWNFQGHRTVDFSEVELSKRPKIIHFVTAAKPWKVEIRNRNAAFYDEFRRQTRFARTYATITLDFGRLCWSTLKRQAKRALVYD